MTAAPCAAAFLDACVLYPALLRNVFMHLALHGLYRPHWSARVHHEWIEALLRSRPALDRERLGRTRHLMEKHAPEALVEAYDFRIEALTLPDPDDRHVLAAAIHCGASAIVTVNLRHFPSAVLKSYGLNAIHPDHFVSGLINDNRAAVETALRQLRGSFRSPRMSVSDLLNSMARQGLTMSARLLVESGTLL